MEYNHLFGPVRSRRLGRSLGVDMIPFKTCNCNCVYCECGGSPPVPHTRAEYVPSDELTGELDKYLSGKPEIDYITFAGSGEPTLNSALGKVLGFVKNRFPLYHTALLTNGTLFHLAAVREETLPFDLVCPSLDAVTPEVFNRINRPYPGLDLPKIIAGLTEFSRSFKGQLWIEVFIVPGINDTREELKLFREVLTAMQPTRVQLNSLDRPGACDWVIPAGFRTLSAIAQFLQPLPVEIIARSSADVQQPLSHPDNLDGTILHQLRRRPATVEEIAVMCSATINEVHPILDRLTGEGRLAESKVNRRTFYRVI
jgi:wyosine [tRNA(Phe)-imidazoG37] synthetase (radical SAM superfamily)